MTETNPAFKKDDIAYIKNVGFGCTSFDKYRVQEVSDGKVYFNALKHPFDVSTGKYLDPRAEGGISISLCVTRAQIERAVREYED